MKCKAAAPYLVLAALAFGIAGCSSAATTQKPVAAAPAPTADQVRAEVAASRADLVAAYDKADLDGFVNLFDDNATYAGLRQTTWVRGKDEIRQVWKIAFQKDPSRRLVYSGEPILYLSPDNHVAVEVGYAMMMMAAGRNVPASRLQRLPMRVSITWIKTDQGWKIVSMDTSLQPASVAPGFLKGH